MSQPSVLKVPPSEVLLRALVAVALLCASTTAASGNAFVQVTGGEVSSALPTGRQDRVKVRSFLLQEHPVTNAEFLAFVTTHAEWRRDAAPRVLAGADYLGHWSGPLNPGPRAEDSQPVTRMSWFAAEAYCEVQNARLPGWYEWELAAAASTSDRDARSDAAWRQQILDWYARPVGARLPSVQGGVANIYGLYDMHGLVWEWVQDFNSLLPADADPQQFCGSGAQNLQQKENYAVLMRIAMLGSLRASDTGHLVGFRCARDAQVSP